MQVMLPADEDLQVETQSKFSIGGSSTRSGHSKASSRQHRRHKKPNRRRSRQQLKTSGKDKEPVYNNLKENEDIDAEVGGDSPRGAANAWVPLPALGSEDLTGLPGGN